MRIRSQPAGLFLAFAVAGLASGCSADETRRVQGADRANEAPSATPASARPGDAPEEDASEDGAPGEDVPENLPPWGGLDVRLAGGTDGDGGGPGPIVVMLHGWGASADDLVPMARVLELSEEVRFAFPQAPLTRPEGGRAWWHIDRAAREALFERTGRPYDFAASHPDGLPEARRRVLALLAFLARTGTPSERVVLGGFSQGAMLAMDVALHHDGDLAGLLALSGTLLAEDEWRPRMPSLVSTPVLLSHGRGDPLLPHAGTVALQEALRGAGVEVEMVSFDGGHTIPGVVRRRAETFLKRVLP